MRISVVGCGYVGLVTGACLAEVGHDITCTDKDGLRIATLQRGGVPIYEQHLEPVLAANSRAGRISFTGDAAGAVRDAEIIFICVGTPPLENGDADLSAIDDVARLIAGHARTPKLVVEKSTVPAQTGRQLRRELEVYSRNGGAKFRVASNPEFLREGTAVHDFLHPDRIVIGVDDEATERQLRDIYRPILEGRFRCPVHAPACPPAEAPQWVVTTMNSAELIKHASNSFLALKISYANAIADLCERLNADVEEVTRAMGMDPRIGPQFLRAGLGYGGFCLPKDVQAFLRLADRAGVDFGMLREAERINRSRIDLLLDKVRRALWVIKDKKVAVVGLAFKPGTDDIRFSPALEVIRRLLAEGASVSTFDPAAMDKARAELREVRYARDPYDAAQDADALLILTEWPEFAGLDWLRIGSRMARPLVIDARNLLAPAAMEALGFEYDCFGRLPGGIATAAAPPTPARLIPAEPTSVAHVL